MQLLLEFLKGTPWWVFVLFFYLMFIGFGAVKPSVVSLIKLAILPVLFTALAIHTLIVSFSINSTAILLLAAGLLLGSLVGLLIASGKDYKVDRQHLLILMPGNWSTLILILLIFASKYYFGYALSANPMIIHNLNFEIIMLIVSGICTGLFIGRFICYLYHFLTAPSVDLKQLKTQQ